MPKCLVSSSWANGERFSRRVSSFVLLQKLSLDLCVSSLCGRGSEKGREASSKVIEQVTTMSSCRLMHHRELWETPE